MKALAHLCMVALFLPTLGLAQPPVDLEVGSDLQEVEHLSLDSALRDASTRAAKANVFSLQVRSVKVEGCWGNDVQLPLAVGDVLTPEKISKAMNVLERTITENTLNGYGLRSEGEVGVLYIVVDYDTSDPSGTAQGGTKTVGVTFRPYYVHISLVRIGNNVLPIPRLPFPTYYRNVPEPLLALKPLVGFSYDRQFGAAWSGGVDTNLLALPDPAHSRSSSNDKHQLNLSAQGRKSLDDVFYNADVGLRYSFRQHGALLQELSARANFDGAKVPLGAGKHTLNAGSAGVGATLKLAPNTRLSLDTGYRGSDDSTALGTPTGHGHVSVNEQSNRLLLDAIPRPLEGFLRVAAWEDNGWINGGGAYQRLVGRVGYYKEIPLSLNQTIGLELLAGGGKAWGDVPDYDRFFAGNSAVQFLYDSPSSAFLLKSPLGPLIRSLGEARGGLQGAGSAVSGGDSFWHVNLNLSFPIPRLSYALIPNAETNLENKNGEPLTIKQLLKTQIDVTGPNMLTAVLKNEGMTTEKAHKQANLILSEIKPATHFIIDYANLYSVKPLLMFDAGGISGRGSSSSKTWLAVGGGLQLTLVIAKLEVGYMQSISGPSYGHSGNFFTRLVFQNLF